MAISWPTGPFKSRHGCLGVLAPRLYVPSETFIQRHIDELLPGRTVWLSEGRGGTTPAAGQGTTPLLNLRSTADKRWHIELTRAGQRRGHERLGDQAAVAAFFLRHGVGAVLGEYLDTSLRYLGTCKTLGMRFVAHAHGYDVSQLLRDERVRDGYRRLNGADAVVTMSRYSKQKLIDVGVDAQRIHVVPYGVVVPPKRERRELGGSLRVLAVGRLVAKKAPIYLLESFCRALAAAPGLRLDIVGDGPLLAAARQFVVANGLHDAVHLHGAQQHEFVQQLLSQADVFMQHSVVDPDSGDEEGMPVAILEAMAHGLPVLTTRHAGIPEVIEEGRTGRLVTEGDVDAMAARLVELAHDAAQRQHLGDRARHRILQGFTWEHERDQLLHLLGFA